MGKKLSAEFVTARCGPWRFRLMRKQDQSGVSGVGHIANGALFDDGVCVLRWCTEHRSTGVYESHDQLMAIHGHDGATECEWIDPPTNGAFRRGVADAEQDSFENSPFASIGGLEQRDDPHAPDYVEECDRIDYMRGYLATAREMYGKDWRTCSFSWGPVLEIGR